MKSLRFDIYLPLYHNEKDSSGQRIPVEPKKFLDTFNDLRDRFRGVSVEENTILGSWLDDEDIINDDELRVYHIAFKLSADNLQWISNYQDALEDRFRQCEIFMYYIVVYRF